MHWIRHIRRREIQTLLSFTCLIAITRLYISLFQTIPPSGNNKSLKIPSALRTLKTTHNQKSATVSTSKAKHHFVLTFLGDTMFANAIHNWEVLELGPSREIDEGFWDVKHLLKKSDYIIMNLEGAISLRPRSSVPSKIRRSEAYTFAMHPQVTTVFKELGVGAINLGNNHQGDVGTAGYNDTKYYLERAGLPHFGSGWTAKEKAEPLILDTPEGRIGVTSYMGAPHLKDDRILDNNGSVVHITVRPSKKNAELGIKLLNESNVDIKIGFPHWMRNRWSYVPNVTRDAARTLADAGYDVLIGSAGTHTVKEFDFVNGVPVMYDIGNFVFMKHGKWHETDDRNRTSLTYGSVTHLIIEDGRPKELEIHCTQNDQEKVHYKPRVCTGEEAAELFSVLGPYIDYKSGHSFATVDLRDQTKKNIDNTIM